MENMLNPSNEYPFDEIKIKTPKALQGGTYCANLELHDTPIIIQTPKCKTKNGIHITSKQIYCDLLMDSNHKEFVDWLEKFQERIRNLILENSKNWFHENPSMDEIEYNWNNSIRIYKGNNYLVRSFVHKTKGINKSSLQIFDTDENKLELEDVDSNKSVICILEIIGLKFSSQSFHLEICLRQMMVINEKPIFNKCLIKFNKTYEPKNENGEKLLENKKKPIIKNLEKINKVHLEELDDNEEDKVKESVLDNIVDSSTNTSAAEKEEEEAEEEIEEVATEEVQEETEEEIEGEKGDNEDNNVKEKNLENESLENKNTTPEKNDEDSILGESSPLEKFNDLEEIELNIDDTETIKLKNPNEVYLDIYKAARERAKKAKNEAIKAYLEAKKIKELYMLDVADSSDEEEEEEEELFSEN